MFVNYISWLLFGALTGWTVSRISESKHSAVGRINIILGIMGSLVTGLILQLSMGSDAIRMFNVSILIAAILGSITLLMTIRSVVHT